MAIIPDTNINLSNNIGAVLRDAGGNVDVNNAITFFRPENININAKHKPVRHTKLFDLTDSDLQSVNFGIEVTEEHGYGAVSVMAAALRNGTFPDWTYAYPRGGQNEPYRLSDFRKYYTDAKFPVGKNTQGTVNMSPSTSNLTLWWNWKQPNDYEISISEFFIKASGIYATDMYLGALLFDGSTQIAGTDTSKIGSYTAGDNTIGVTLKNYPYTTTRTWSLVPFLSTLPFNLGDSPSAATMYPIPNTESTLTVRYASPVVRILVYGFFLSSDMNTLHYGFTIQNGTGSSLTTGTITVVLLNSNEDVIGRVTTVDSQTVPAGDSFYYQDKTANISGDISYNARYIQVYYGSGVGRVEGQATISIEDTIP